jgi:hypothetical protein
MPWNNNKSGLPKLPGLPGLKKLPKEYNDANLNGQLPLKTSMSLPSTRLTPPSVLAAPKQPTMLGGTDKDPNASPKQRTFRKLAGLLGPKK